MTCSNCGAVFDDTSRFCGICGTPLTAEKKGTHRVPILILLLLSVIGVSVFFAAGGTVAPATPTPEISQDSVFTVTHGALSADSKFEGVTELTVPETIGGLDVTALNRYCFAECDDLTVVHLPDTVTTIGEFAFAGCDSLRAMDLPGSVKKIKGDAFRACASLEAIHIPASVAEIGLSAFDECGSLAFIFYDGTIDEWRALYDEILPPETTVCCTDGTFYQPE